MKKHRINSIKTALKIFLKAASALAFFALIFFIFLRGTSSPDAFLQKAAITLIGAEAWWLYPMGFIAIVSATALVALGALIAYITYAKARNSRRTKLRQTLFTSYLTNYLLTDNTDLTPELVERLKLQLRSKKNILAFFVVYTRIQEIIAVDFSNKFLILLDTLDIRKKIEVLLYSNDFSDKIIAFKIISLLKIQKYNKEIESYLNSSNHALRTEAVVSQIMLSDNDDFSNISDIINHSAIVSMMDVNIIVNAVLKASNSKIDYDSLLMADHPNKKMIAVKIIKHKEIRSLKDKLIPLLNHTNEQLSFEAWDAFLSLENDGRKLEEAIVANYPLQSDKVKHLIISKGMLVQSESYINFLKRLVEFDMSLSIKASAMKTLFKHDIALISSYASSKDTKIGKAYKEVVDFYL